jgi:hypothetical protein
MFHRENVDLDFGMGLLKEIGDAKNSKIILITLKTEGNSGCFLLRGGEDEGILSKENIIKIGEELCSMLDGKGSLQGKGGHLFQAKVNKINGIVKAQKMFQKMVHDLQKVVS